MSLTLIAFAGFYAPARHTVQYADTLAQALGSKLVLLHVNRASIFDPYELVDESYRQEELARQTDTAAALYRLAEELPSHPTVEVATDLLPVVAQDLAERHHPALFVLRQPDPAHSVAADLAEACAEILRAGHYPLLLAPADAPADQAPRRILIAADREPFTLASASLPLRQLLALPGAELTIAHVSSGVEDDAGCAAALHAVQVSGLLKGLPTPELCGYEYTDVTEGLLAAVKTTQADLVIVLARERSFMNELFHRSVTARLLAHCPVPVLVLPVKPEAPEPTTAAETDSASWANTLLKGLAPAS